MFIRNCAHPRKLRHWVILGRTVPPSPAEGVQQLSSDITQSGSESETGDGSRGNGERRQWSVETPLDWVELSPPGFSPSVADLTIPPVGGRTAVPIGVGVNEIIGSGRDSLLLHRTFLDVWRLKQTPFYAYCPRFS